MHSEKKSPSADLHTRPNNKNFSVRPSGAPQRVLANVTCGTRLGNLLQLILWAEEAVLEKKKTDNKHHANSLSEVNVLCVLD